MVELHPLAAPVDRAEIEPVSIRRRGQFQGRAVVRNYAGKTSLQELAAIPGASPVDAEECEREFRSRLGEYGFEGGQFRLAVAPACSGLSRERMLRREEWVEIVAQRIARCEPATAELHLLGGPADRAELEQMKTLLEERFQCRVVVRNHAGRTSLQESVRIIAAMDEVLCIDSALLHFSRLLGRRTVSFWGPTDPRTLLRPNSRSLDEIHYVADWEGTLKRYYDQKNLKFIVSGSESLEISKAKATLAGRLVTFPLNPLASMALNTSSYRCHDFLNR